MDSHLFRHNPPSMQYSNHHQPKPGMVQYHHHQSMYSTPTQASAGSNVIISQGSPWGGTAQNKSGHDIWNSEPDKSDGVRAHPSPGQPHSNHRGNIRSAESSPYRSLFAHGPPQQHPYNNLQIAVGIEFEKGRLVVASLVPGCSAARSREVAPGDELIAVEGYQDIDLSRARSLILGRQGTYVNLTFRRNNQRFKVKLMRGSHDYMEMQEQNHAAQTRILELEKRISTLETDNDKLEAAIQRSGRNDSQHEYLQNLQIQVKELENQVQMMKDEKQEAREMVFKEKNEEIRSQKSEIDLLRMQVSSLQKLIGEKDGQVNQTKAKAREQNNSNAARLRQAEETLKENVASSSQTIEKLNKELQDARLELENLRVENQALRDQRLEDGAVKAFQPIWSQSNNLVQQQRTSSQPHQTSPQERQKKMLDTVTVSESRSLQSFQHTPQRVQFQELPVSASNGGVKEEPPVDLIMPHQVRVSSPHRQQLNSPPVSPHRNLMHSPPVPDFPYAREGPAALAWGVVPAPRTTEDSPGSRIPYPPSADVQELQTYSESRPHRDDVGSIASHESEQERQGDVQLSQRPGIVTSRTIPGAGAYLNISSYTSSAGNDVSFRNRAPVMASSYQALPPHFPPAMPQGQFSHHHVPWQPYSGLSMYPGPSPMPLRMPFNSNTWGHGW